jgi:nucleotide sugar dehydrogenase
MEGFRKAIRILGERMKSGSLMIVETTVPPGTCEKIVAPELEACLKRRNLAPDSIMLAHSYERVMPGKDYYDSIVNFWRVYAGHTPEAAEGCHAFLSKVVNTKSFPLTRLGSTTASETAKVLENSYRATTIAFIEEWGRYAEAVGIDLFEILKAIRVRPTHSNIRQPGFGVGGYCLTKDPYFTELAAKELFDRPDLKFPFSTEAVKINNKMPLVSLEKLQSLLGGDLKDKRILLMGVSYRDGVADSRHSPSEIFVREALNRGARVVCHDPLVKEWPEIGTEVVSTLPPASTVDAVVFAVQHSQYSHLDFKDWFKTNKVVVLDGNNVLDGSQRQAIRAMGCKIASIGRGDLL